MDEIKRLLDKRLSEKRVVVLGQQDDTKMVLSELNKRQSECVHLEDITDLEATLSQQSPELALVVGADFQEKDARLHIQRLVGEHPCLVLYVDVEKT